ncbi:ornithine decarboxylase [Blyttiomyces helicus]|uniref:ornithine decarboxylase n=1 Tax=Blyttiomyces helicus TaxID=388810 RepID=A0A4P9WHX1_9FUNG|nr:ornithine decarboxylase [Blyttiomyces helicus]|eukprot:RKO91453.1 ornithine decarboxylase [Blyttiomyces helicus]
MKEISAGLPNPLESASALSFVKLSSKTLPKQAMAAKVITPIPEVSARSVSSLIEDRAAEDAFFVADLGEVTRQHNQWKAFLPRIEPFYAVKSNPDPMILRTLAGHGTGFDCASKAEIQMALDQGVPASRIIYANPCKQASHIRYAAAAGVTMMTFDNADELHKIRAHHPAAKMILRILTDDSRSICKLGVKFGAHIGVVPTLLQTAQDLEVDVIGISFHVGSGCYDASAFGEAVILARKAFDIGKEFGFTFTLLDVGGGFPSNNADGVTFPDIATILAPTVDRLFDSSVRVIAEPGRYYCNSAYTLAVNIVARRMVPRDISPSVPSVDSETMATNVNDDHPAYMYYINDGMYGSFNCITFDHAVVIPKVLSRSSHYYYGKHTGDIEYSCSIWGPTCDSIDCMGRNFSLPEMQVGDWLYFDNMGAYTMCAASQFNGFRKSSIVYTNTEAAGPTHSSDY